MYKYYYSYEIIQAQHSRLVLALLYQAALV